MQIQRKQEIAKKAIMDACLTCNGQGCRDCAAQVERINVLSNAGIPVAYWDYSLKSFAGDEKFKQKIIELASSVDKIYSIGKSIVLMGPLGIGKTFGGIEILKSAVVRGHTILYTTIHEIIDMLLSKEDRYNFKNLLLNSQYVMIDEFDTRHMPSTEYAKEIFGENLESIIRSRFQNKLPIIFSTNNSSMENMFDGPFREVFNSLFTKNNLIIIPVGGKDLRL